MSDSGSDLDHARRLYRDRRARDEVLGAHWFGEPAWDLMLHLFIARCQDRPVLMMTACMAASLPLAAGMRWLSKLEEQGLIERISGAGNEGAAFVAFSDAGFDRMSALLRQMV